MASATTTATSDDEDLFDGLTMDASQEEAAAPKTPVINNHGGGVVHASPNDSNAKKETARAHLELLLSPPNTKDIGGETKATATAQPPGQPQQ